MRTSLIGEGALALRCLQALCARGLKPALVCSPDGSLAEAAARLDIAHVDQRGEWALRLSRLGVDHLFSVRNPWILSAHELAQVKGMAVNFHDSLLPRYAGMHATSWALIKGEVEHGITWHEITPAIDAGRILAQVRVAVLPDDTALALNTRCFDAAAQAFAGLLDELSHGAWTLQPQLGPRSYFGARMRPSAQAAIDLAGSAQSVVNLVRALDFGLAPNPLGLAKLWLGKQWLIVKRAQVLQDSVGARCGVVREATPAAWRVDTASGAVELSGLSWLDGQAVTAESLRGQLAGLEGGTLPGLSEGEQARLTAIHERVCLKEKRWAAALAQGVHAITLPGMQSSARAPLTQVAMPHVQAALAALESHRQASRIQAAWALYQARVSREAVFDIGLVNAQALTHGMGLFAPILPCRVNLDPGLSFEEWAHQTDERIERVTGMDTFALDLLIRTPELRGASVLPARWPVAMLLGPDVPLALGEHASLVLHVSDEGRAVNWLAAADVPRALLDAMDLQLATLIQASERMPACPVATLPLVAGAERERMLVTWNATSTPIPNRCMHELFADQVQRSPQAPAARWGEQVLTYAELEAHADRLARRLKALGVGVGDLVGLSVQRGFDVLIGMLGILKSGAAYVPIDPDYPSERMVAMLTQSQARVVVTHERARQALARLGVDWGGVLLSLDGASLLTDELAVLPSEPGVTPDDLVYCLFTSGSSGTPKGVEIRHRSLVNHALAVRSVYGLGAGERALLSASMSFDVAAEQIYPALISGAEVVIRPDDLFESLERFDRFVREQGISVLTLPAALWHEWVRFLAARSLRVPPSLKAVGVGTEKVLGECLAQWRALGGAGLRFIQGYGPTEATVTCTMYIHEGDHGVDAQAPLPIGRPLPNTEIYVLDQAGEPVPVGMEGEIHVGGMGLARGYLGRPDLTAQQFIPHPFHPDPQARLYKTGDLGRFEADGQLVYVGRADFQVKVRGFRVELGEIEAVLRQHPNVVDAVVLLREDVPGARRLVAYVLGDGGAVVEVPALEALCRQRLPDYMVPAAFMALEAFPVNINGKVDRKALPAPQLDAEAGAVVLNYRDDLELVVAQAFSQALSRPSVPLQDSFFDMGGDSLGAMGLIAQLEAALSVSLSLSDLFDSPSVVAMAERIRTGSAGGAPLILQLREGHGVPIWLLAGVLQYEPLARAMSGDNPVYVVLLPMEEAMIRDGSPLPSLDIMAESYMEVVRRHTPCGPYVLGGFSIGGAIAYEVSRRLAEQGERIEQLVLFDTTLPSALGPGTQGSGLLAWAMRQRHALAEGGWRVLLARSQRLLNRLIERRAEAPGARERHRMHVKRLAEFSRVLSEFEQGLRPYHGPVVLYRSRGEDAYRSVAPGHGFARMIRGPWSQVQVDGDHMGMMTPDHVGRIAQDLTARLGAPVTHPTSEDLSELTL